MKQLYWGKWADGTRGIENAEKRGGYWWHQGLQGERGGNLEQTGKKQTALLIPQTLAVPKHPSSSFSSAHPSWVPSLPPVASITIYLMTTLKSASQTLNSLLNSKWIDISIGMLHGVLSHNMYKTAFITFPLPQTYSLSRQYLKYNCLMTPPSTKFTEFPNSKGTVTYNSSCPSPSTGHQILSIHLINASVHSFLLHL